MKRIGFVKLSTLALALSIAGATVSGCHKDGDVSDGTHELGAVGFKLTMPGGVSIDTINYTITGPASYTKTGTIPVGGSGTTFSAKIDGIPTGTGYTMKLDATEADGKTKCMGSATFNVVANSVTAVSIRLQCPGKSGGTGSGDTGSVTINGEINICAVVVSATATPSADGKTIALSGSGSDIDMAPAAITYKWTASIGTLSGSSATDVTLTCPAAGGSVDIVFEVSDTDCGDKMTLATVTCAAGGGGGCGNGAPAGCSAGGSGAIAGTGAVGGTLSGGTGAVGGTVSGGTGAVGGTVSGGTGAVGGTVSGGTGAVGGTVSGGTGAVGGSTGGGACNTCETMAHDLSGTPNTSCPDSHRRCAELPGMTAGGPMTGVAKSSLCTQIVTCMQTSHCAQLAATDCLCGANVDPNACFNGTFDQTTGPCKDIISAGGESTTMSDLANRFTDPTFAVGAADSVIETCDQFFCATECL